MVFQARGPSLMAALGPGVGICGRPGGLEKKVVLREMDVESPATSLLFSSLCPPPFCTAGQRETGRQNAKDEHGYRPTHPTRVSYQLVKSGIDKKKVGCGLRSAKRHHHDTHRESPMSWLA